MSLKWTGGPDYDKDNFGALCRRLKRNKGFPKGKSSDYMYVMSKENAAIFFAQRRAAKMASPWSDPKGFARAFRRLLPEEQRKVGIEP